MASYTRVPIYITVVLLTFIIGCRKWKLFFKADKVILVLIALTFIQELIAYGCAKLIGNNVFTFHFYSPLEFFLLCLYFNSSSKFFKRTGLGLIIGGVGVIFSVINTIYIQPLTTFNSYFLLFEGTAIIILCLYSLSEILLVEEEDFKKRSHFWITLALMFYWSITYTGWGIFNLLDGKTSLLLLIFKDITYTANLLFYMGLTLVFINYRKFCSSAT